MISNLLYVVFMTVYYVLRGVDIAVFVYVITTWVAPMSRLRMSLERFLQPVFAPFRPLGQWVARRFGIPLDFTCLFAILALEILERVVIRLYWMLI